jgi:hypothetical protein
MDAVCNDDIILQDVTPFDLLHAKYYITRRDPYLAFEIVVMGGAKSRQSVDSRWRSTKDCI